MRVVASLALASCCVLLAAGCGSSSRPRPDIVFVSSRGGDYAIYGMNADGSRTRRLSKAEKGDASSPQKLFFQDQPAWSPDGRLIAFTSKREGPTHVFVMRSDGAGTRRLTSSKDDDSHPTWSPDGRFVAFARGPTGDLWRVGSDGAREARIDSDPAEETDPAWSPTGRWLAYSRRTPGTSVREIWLMRPDGSGRHALTRLGAASTEPAWSPDGRELAFTSDVRGRRNAVYTIGAGGKGLTRRTRGDDEFDPSWAPDGKTLVYSRGGTIYVLAPSGGERALTKGENDVQPTWRPTSPVR